MLELQEVLQTVAGLDSKRIAEVMSSAVQTDHIGLGLVHYALWPESQRMLKTLLQMYGVRLAGAQDPWGKTVLHHLACLSDSRLFEELAEVHPVLLRVTDNCWRTPLHTLLYRGHLECAVRVILKTQAWLHPADLKQTTLVSLLQQQETRLRGLLWNYIETTDFQSSERLLTLLNQLFERPMTLPYIGLTVLHDMLRKGPLSSVEYLVSRYPDLLSSSASTTKKKRPLPSVWIPPLHYLCMLKTEEQPAKLRLLLSVCSLDFDSLGHSPILYLLANKTLTSAEKLRFFRQIKQEKGKETLKNALVPEWSLVLCSCAGAADLLIEVLECCAQEPDCEVTRTLICAGDSRGLSVLQERGGMLIQGENASAFFIGARQKDSEIRVKVLAWARARHMTYLQQSLTVLETEVTEQLGTKFGGFTFNTLKKTLSPQCDLDLIRLCAVLIDDFEETPNILAEIIKTSQPSGLIGEVVLAACMLSLWRGKLEVITPLLSIAKAKEAMEGLLRGKALFLHIKSRWQVNESTLSALAELSTCGVRFRHLEERYPTERRRDPDILRLWRRGLISLKASKFEVLTRLLRISPEDVLPRALAHFRKHARKVETSALPALFLTLREAFRSRDTTAAAGSQILLDWAKTGVDSDEALPWPAPKSLRGLLTQAYSLAHTVTTQSSAAPYVKRHLRKVMLTSVPANLPWELWKPWERHFVSLCDKKEEAAEELLSEAPTDVFLSLYQALATDLRTDKRLSFGLFALELLEQRRCLDLLKPVFESLLPLSRRNADRCSESDGWIRVLAGWASAQDLLTVSGLDIPWTSLLDCASEDTLLALFRRQPVQEEYKPFVVLRTIRRRRLWRLLHEICQSDLPPHIRRLAQEEWLLHIDPGDLESILPSLLPNLCLRRLALASPDILESLVLRLEHFTCGRMYGLPEYVSSFSGLTISGKFEKSTEHPSLSPFTPKLLSLSIPQLALHSGLLHLIRWQRSDDFISTLHHLNPPDYESIWTHIKQAALRPDADLGRLEVMARAMVHSCTDSDMLVTVLIDSFEVDLMLNVPMRRGITGEELAMLLQKVGVGLRKCKNSQKIRMRAQSCIERVAALWSGSLPIDLAQEIGEHISTSDLIELMPSLSQLLPSEVCLRICRMEVRRGHVEHVKEILKVCTPGPEMMVVASKSPCAEEIVRLMVNVELPDTIQQRLLQQGRPEVLRQLFHSLTSDQVPWLLLSNSLSSLTLYHSQLIREQGALLQTTPLLLQKHLFTSLSYVLEIVTDKDALRTALLQDIRSVGDVYGLAPKQCTQQVKSVLGEDIWDTVLNQQHIEGGLSVLHNILAVPQSHIDLDTLQPAESISDLPVLANCCSPHPLLTHLPQDFWTKYDLQYQSRSLSKAERLNLIDEAPVSFFMSHILALKIAGASFAVQDQERKLLQLHDVICRLQFLVSLDFPLSNELMSEAARQGREDVVLFLLELMFDFPPDLMNVVKTYREDSVILPDAFLMLLRTTFHTEEPRKQVFDRTVAGELLGGQRLPRCMWLVAQTHRDLLLEGRPCPLLQVLLVGQVPLFTLLVETMSLNGDLPSSRLAALLDSVDAAALQGVPCLTLRLELTRRNLLPPQSLPALFQSFPTYNQDEFSDFLFLAISKAEELRVKIHDLKQTLPGSPESNTRLPYDLFEDIFRRYEISLSHFSIQVDSQLWNSFKSKTRPWSGLYLASQFCGSAGLQGLISAYSSYKENFHFIISFEPSRTEIIPNGYNIHVKPAWRPHASEAFVCDLELTYTIPQVYPIVELQDRIRQFTMTLNNSEALSFVSVTLTSNLSLDDYEILRSHILQEPSRDICGIQGFEERLIGYVNAEGNYFQLAMSELRIELDEIQVHRSSLEEVEDLENVCTQVNRLLNPLDAMEIELELKCVSREEFATTAGYRVSVQSESVIWDYSSLSELRILQIRSIFHQASLFESPVVRYIRVSIDAEKLIQLQGKRAEEVANRLVPVQLWFELEQLFGFFTDLQGVLVVPREGKGELEFSRVGSVLLVYVSCEGEQVWPEGWLGVKALTVWTPPETWERCVVASRLLASGDLERGKSYEWLDFFEYLERLLRPVDSFFRNGSRFLVVSELDRDQIKALISTRYPALSRPDLSSLQPLYRDWDDSQQFLTEIRQAVSLFLLNCGLQASENLKRLGEEQLELLRNLGESAEDKNNMVLYRLITVQGRLALDLDYFTFEAEKLPYALTMLRRDSTYIERHLSIDRFKRAFLMHHGVELDFKLSLCEQFQSKLYTSPESFFQHTLNQLKFLLCEFQTALIRSVTFIDMTQHIHPPELPKRQQPSSLTVNVATCFRSLTAVIVEEEEICLFESDRNTLRIGINTEVQDMLGELRKVVMRQWGEVAGVEGVALRAAESLLRERLRLTAEILRMNAGQLTLHQGSGLPFTITSTDQGLNLLLSAKHSNPLFLPQISHLVFTVKPHSARKSLHRFLSSGYFTSHSNAEIEGDLMHFALHQNQRRTLTSFEIVDLESLLPIWFGQTQTKERVSETDGLEVRFNDMAIMEYEQEVKEEDSLLSDHAPSVSEASISDFHPLEITAPERRSAVVVPHSEEKPFLNTGEVFGSQSTNLPLFLRPHEESKRPNRQEVSLSSEELSSLLPVLANPALEALTLKVKGEVSVFPLRSHTHLREFRLSQTTKSALVINTLVQKSPDLETIVLDNCLDDVSLKEVAVVLTQLHKLQRLSLQNNGLTVESVPSLVSVLENCPQVVINLHGNSVGSGLRAYRRRVEMDRRCECCELF